MRKVVLLLAGLAMFAVPGISQVLTGALSGTVVDPSGHVIPNAIVKVTSELTGETRTTPTSETGDFAFSALVAGEYTVRVEAAGFRPLERRGTNVLSAGRPALGNLQLEVGSIAESVTVNAQGAEVATTTTASQAVIDSKQVAMISIRGR